MVYKIMGSDFFINNAMRSMDFSYKVLGQTLTNFFINRSVGSLFTAGESIQTLEKDIKELQIRHVGGIGNYVVEGLEKMDQEIINKVHADLIKAITSMTEKKVHGEANEEHLAIKFTSLLSTDVMT